MLEAKWARRGEVFGYLPKSSKTSFSSCSDSCSSVPKTEKDIYNERKKTRTIRVTEMKDRDSNIYVAIFVDLVLLSTFSFKVAISTKWLPGPESSFRLLCFGGGGFLSYSVAHSRPLHQRQRLSPATAQPQLAPTRGQPRLHSSSTSTTSTSAAAGQGSASTRPTHMHTPTHANAASLPPTFFYIGLRCLCAFFSAHASQRFPASALESSSNKNNNSSRKRRVHHTNERRKVKREGRTNLWERERRGGK